MFPYKLSWTPDTTQIGSPIYYKLYEYIVRDIQSGRLTPNYKMPSQRDLANYLNINFTTVTKSYELAIKNGFLYGIKGKGTFVSPEEKIDKTQKHMDIPDNLFNLGFVDAFEKQNSAVHSVFLQAFENINTENLFKYINNHMEQLYSKVAIEWAHALGFPLRENDNILIVNGAQGGLSVVLGGLFKSGDAIAVDEYTYSNFIELAKIFGIHLIPVKTDDEGLMVNQLKLLCNQRHIRGVYVMPLRGNPTNVEMSLKRRYGLADLAQKFDLTIIEDDYIRFIDPLKYPSLLELAPNNTIEVISTSKAIAPGIRVGYLLFNQKFYQPLNHAFSNLQLHVSTLDLELIANIFSQGGMNKILNNRLSQLNEVNHIFNQIFEVETSTSFHKWISLYEDVNYELILKEIQKNNLIIREEEFFYPNVRSNHCHIRVSLTSTTTYPELKKALKILKSIFSGKIKRID